MSKYIMALDEGTTSCRCILFDRQGQVCSVAQQEFAQFFPNSGWVEHDAYEILHKQVKVVIQAMANIGAVAGDIAAIGITNQRETTVVWNKITGKPVYNAIVWQCRRTAQFCDELKEQGYADIFRKKTGLVIDAYFSATKIRWILDNVPGARKQAENGELLFGTIETWLIWNLTGGRAHVTDYTNASRTMLFNINTLEWDKEILKIIDIPEQMLPRPCPSSGIFGVADASFFGGEIPIAGAAGDQQCALFGQTCFEKGEAKNTYGTGCFLLMNTGDKPAFSDNGLVTTVAWGIGDEVNYALEGSVFVAGAAITWLRDELRIIGSPKEMETLAREVEDTNDCFVVPAFTGLGAPYWDQYARGCIVGLTRGTNRYHIVRATLESIAFQVNDIIEVMRRDSGLKIESLKVDGGASVNNLLMQMQADICGVIVRRPSNVETTALGAAYFAGLGVGFWKSTEELRTNQIIDMEFRPEILTEESEKKVERWRKAVLCSRNWAES